MTFNSAPGGANSPLRQPQDSATIEALEGGILELDYPEGFRPRRRGGLSVLVHPMTGDDAADHDTNPLWLGERLPIDIEFLRRHAVG